MKWCSFFVIFVLALGCSLSASQEATLHQALTSYIDAHNKGAVMAYVGHTHPNVVGYYENQGDSLFREKFELFVPEDGGDYLQDGIVNEIEKNGSELHVRYVFHRFGTDFLESEDDEIGIIAISNDGGKTWFFADEKDYCNTKIFTKEERLIDL